MMAASMWMVVWDLPNPAVVESYAITGGWPTAWVGENVEPAKTISDLRHNRICKGANLEPRE